MAIKDSLEKIIKAMNADSQNFPFYQYPDLASLTVVQAQYLEVICEIEDPTISKLAKMFHVTKPTVSIIVDRLVQRGYIQKVKSELDERVYHLSLSSKGKELYKRYKAHDDKSNSMIIKKIQKHLSQEDVKQLSEILDRLARVL